MASPKNSKVIVVTGAQVHWDHFRATSHWPDIIENGSVRDSPSGPSISWRKTVGPQGQGAAGGAELWDTELTVPSHVPLYLDE